MDLWLIDHRESRFLHFRTISLELIMRASMEMRSCSPSIDDRGSLHKSSDLRRWAGGEGVKPGGHGVHAVNSLPHRDAQEQCPPVTTVMFSLSGATRARFDCFDFWWGKPVYGGAVEAVCVLSIPWLMSFLLASKNANWEDGIIAPMCLHDLARIGWWRRWASSCAYQPIWPFCTSLTCSQSRGQRYE